MTEIITKVHLELLFRPLLWLDSFSPIDHMKGTY